MKIRSNRTVIFLLSAVIILCSRAFAQSTNYSNDYYLDIPLQGFGSHTGSHLSDQAGSAFLEHNGMPHDVGEVDIRATEFNGSLAGKYFTGTAIHLEAGLWDGIGLHVLNDDVANDGTEVMIQMAVIRSADKREGLSFTISNAFPDSNGLQLKAFETGFTGTKMLWGNPLHLTLHYHTNEQKVEFDSSYVQILPMHISLICEYSTEVTDVTSAYLLEGIRYSASELITFAVGVQFPESEIKDFDTRMLFQADLAL